jgi:phospholipase C
VENRSFDHLFATYRPKREHEHVLNLLSQRIVNADGSPGPNFAQAQQYELIAPPNNGKFFISADQSAKALYPVLPPPDIGAVPKVSPLAFILTIPGGDPGLRPKDQFLFGTGGTGLDVTLGPDTRIPNVSALPPGPFQLTSPTLPYDAFTADTMHEFFQMYQQMDCAIERNWRLEGKLSSRSRDNLPNPKTCDNPYVPPNMPAIGDLFDMFDFGSDPTMIIDRAVTSTGAECQPILE